MFEQKGTNVDTAKEFRRAKRLNDAYARSLRNEDGGLPRGAITLVIAHWREVTKALRAKLRRKRDV